jgi:hypothetical protein
VTVFLSDMYCRISQLWWDECQPIEYWAPLIPHIKVLAVKVNDSCFKTHVDTSPIRPFFQNPITLWNITLPHSPLTLLRHISPIALLRTELSKVYTVRLSLPLHVIHSSYLTAILNAVRTSVSCAYHTYAVKFQTKPDFVRAWRGLVSSILSWLFW